MSKKHIIEYVKKSFGAEGYTLISEEYKNAHSKLISICPNGHEYAVSFGKWLAGRRCLCKSGRQRLTIEFIKKEFEKRGYTLLSKERKYNEKLKYICPEGHEHEIRWDHFHNGHGCPYCNGRPVIKIEDVKASFEIEGYTLLSKEYVNSNSPLEYICPQGHRHSMRWRFWKNCKCPECATTMKKTIEFIRSEFEKSGYKVLTKNYINHHQKLHTMCPKGHDYYVSWSNWNQNGSRCVVCKEWGTSKQEKIIVDFVKTLFEDVVEHDRELIKPLEIDIIIPAKKIAIEYCGLRWHSDEFGKKDNTYHLNKLTRCEENGYSLLTIFEDELVYKKDIIFSRLKNLLTINSTDIIYARNCFIKEIDSKQASMFCTSNHTQGYGSGARVRLGAFYKNELVSVMTFSKPSVAKGSRNTTGLVWELHRFCSKINYRVIGIASKLLKHFERNYEWNNIFSYADRRWSSGNVYSKLGFEFSGYTKPNYWYIKGQKRLHRFGLRKTKDDPKYLTEWEIRKSQGWDRIWDCGNIRFDKNNVIN